MRSGVSVWSLSVRFTCVWSGRSVWSLSVRFSCVWSGMSVCEAVCFESLERYVLICVESNILSVWGRVLEVESYVSGVWSRMLRVCGVVRFESGILCVAVWSRMF